MSSEASVIDDLSLQLKVGARPEEVFDALTDPRHQRQWLSALGPDAGAVRTSVDLRVGGTWEASFLAASEIAVHDVWTFREIAAPHRLVADLVSESSMNGTPAPALESRVAITISPTESGSIVAIEQDGFASAEVRGLFENVAWPGAFARIDAHLSKRDA